jgi:hypothetical protein
MSTPLTVEEIFACDSDEELTSLLCQELTRLIPEVESMDQLLDAMDDLPYGLRAMAATHRLDISLALDSLWEHFANFHSLAYARETLAGLKELEATVLADLFAPALNLAEANWEMFAHQNAIETGEAPQFENDKVEAVKQEMQRLSSGMWEHLDTLPTQSLMDYWPIYARKNSDRLIA